LIEAIKIGETIMSKKNLLNEATVRRFMQLANMEPLSSPFVERLNEMGAYGVAARDDEDEPVEEMAHADAARDDDEPMELDMEMGDDPEDEVGGPPAEEPLDPDVVARLEDFVQDIVSDLADRASELGVDVDVSADEAAPDMEPAPEADEPAPAEVDDEPVMEDDTTTVDEAEHDDDDALKEVEVVNDDDLISEVAKRVTARLVKVMASKAAKK
jgi:hypothetical protein